MTDDPGPGGGGGGMAPGQVSREEWMRQVMGDIDPAKYAGEGWFSTEEYARPQDIQNPYTRHDVGREGDYYPSPWSRR